VRRDGSGQTGAPRLSSQWLVDVGCNRKDMAKGRRASNPKASDSIYHNSRPRPLEPLPPGLVPALPPSESSLLSQGPMICSERSCFVAERQESRARRSACFVAAEREARNVTVADRNAVVVLQVSRADRHFLNFWFQAKSLKAHFDSMLSVGRSCFFADRVKILATPGDINDILNAISFIKFVQFDDGVVLATTEFRARHILVSPSLEDVLLKALADAVECRWCPGLRPKHCRIRRRAIVMIQPVRGGLSSPRGISMSAIITQEPDDSDDDESTYCTLDSSRTSVPYDVDEFGEHIILLSL
jgi:hypothetical protein